MIDKFPYPFVILVERLKFPRRFQSFLKRHPRARRHRLRDGVHLADRETHDAPDIPNDRPRRQRAERDDLRHMILAVLLRQILNHPRPSAITQIRIDIRHRHTLRIQEPFKEQIKTQRIELRDVQQIRHDAPRRTATPRPYRNPMRFRVMNEIHDDEKIIRKSHAVNHGQLIRKPRAHLVRHILIPLRQRRFAQFPKIRLRRLPLRHRKRRELVLAESKRHAATIRDFSRIFNRARKLPQKRAHLLAALAIKLIICETEMIRVIQIFPRGNTKLDLLRRRILPPDIMEILRRHKPDPVLRRQPRQLRPHRRFLRQPVILQLDEIILLPERIPIKFDHAPRFIYISR